MLRHACLLMVISVLEGHRTCFFMIKEFLGHIMQTESLRSFETWVTFTSRKDVTFLKIRILSKTAVINWILRSKSSYSTVQKVHIRNRPKTQVINQNVVSNDNIHNVRKPLYFVFSRNYFCQAKAKIHSLFYCWRICSSQQYTNI